MARRTLLPVAIALCALLPATSAGAATRHRPAHRAAACAGADVVPTRAAIARARTATLCLLNEIRASHGLHALRANRRLRRAAQSYSRSMVAHGFFAHVSPLNGSTLLTRIRATCYLRTARAFALGENIAWGSGRLGTPRETVQAWMHSPPHRHNILTAGFREIGIGVATGAPVRALAGQAAATYTTDFGSRG